MARGPWFHLVGNTTILWHVFARGVVLRRRVLHLSLRHKRHEPALGTSKRRKRRRARHCDPRHLERAHRPYSQLRKTIKHHLTVHSKVELCYMADKSSRGVMASASGLTSAAEYFIFAAT